MTSATVHPPAGSGRPGPRSRPGGLPRLFWVLWSGILVNRLGTMAEPFLGVYLVAVRGFSVAAAGAVLAIYALGSMLSQILGGALADTLGRPATLTAGMLANGAFLIPLGHSTTPPPGAPLTLPTRANPHRHRPPPTAQTA